MDGSKRTRGAEHSTTLQFVNNLEVLAIEFQEEGQLEDAELLSREFFDARVP